MTLNELRAPVLALIKQKRKSTTKYEYIPRLADNPSLDTTYAVEGAHERCNKSHRRSFTACGPCSLAARDSKQNALGKHSRPLPE
jgi:hypothetical protein